MEEQKIGREQEFAHIALDLPLDRLYTYAVPQELQGRLAVGCRVEVPFGAGNRTMVGYVVELAGECELKKVKPLKALVDDSPLIAGDLMDLARWMSRYYVAPLGQVLSAILPAAVKNQAGFRNVRLVVRGEAPESGAGRILSKQRRVLDQLDALDSPVGPSELARMAGCTTAVIRALEAKGLVKTITEQTDSFVRNFNVRLGDDEVLPELTQEQSQALGKIAEQLESRRFGCIVVNGVTGSGKTEIYLRAMDQATSGGGQAIVLVPEIALTPQTIQRFRRRFNDVAVLHSHLSDVDRHREWRDICDGRARVIVGARSAVFAPARDLRLIVIDEEHENSFKQDISPRYQARDMALMRAHLLGIPVILGSATPSLETKHNCQSLDHYVETRLSERVMNRPMPPVEIIDLKLTMRERKGYHGLSLTLENAIRETLERQEQVILFLNRRGFSTHVFCPHCGYVQKCEHCDVSMTFHRNENLVRCHYCDTSISPPQQCPSCSVAGLNYFGLGTEKLEDEVRRKFPLARLGRMDSDTMRKRGSHDEVLGEFRDRKIDILVGTQMIAKGLDFPNVTLVGVINADVSINLPDFRAAERTFQLISQVSGRAGRGSKPGRILVQTFTPEHEAVRLAASHDYESFAKGELVHRRRFGYPPYVRLARVVVRGEDEQKVRDHAAKLAELLRAEIKQIEPGPLHLLGPAACPIARINRQFRWQMLIKAPQARSMIQLFDRVRGQIMTSLPDLNVGIDIDPVSTL